MARGLVRSPDAMPGRVHVKFSYSAKDADVQEWIWKQPLGAVADMANEYIAAVARGDVIHGHWKHDLVGDVPQKVETRPAGISAAPVARAAGVADDVSSPQQGVLGVEARAAPAETQPVPVVPVIAEEPVAVREPVTPPMAAGPAQPEVRDAAPEPQAEQRQDTNDSEGSASAAPAAAAVPAERVASPIDTANPASAETVGEGKMMRSDVRKIIDQAKNWQKQ